jgi:hypothetical protein
MHMSRCHTSYTRMAVTSCMFSRFVLSQRYLHMKKVLSAVAPIQTVPSEGACLRTRRPRCLASVRWCPLWARCADRPGPHSCGLSAAQDGGGAGTGCLLQQ